MYQSLILFLIFFLNCNSWANELNIEFACSIYNSRGNLVRNYGGEHCIFEDNGNYLIAETNGDLNYRDRTNKILWNIPNLWAHHGLNKSSDNHFLIMSSVYDKKIKPPIRYDIFYKISKDDGKIIAQYSLLKNFDEYSGGEKISSKMLWPLDWIINPAGAKKEATHANSFYEIILKEGGSKKLSHGDYIVNVQGKIPRILILDKNNLKLKHSIIPPDYFLHDVQVISKDHIVYFNNTPGSKNMSRDKVIQIRAQASGKSLIEIFDLNKTSKSPKNYFEKMNPLFFMPKGGSVQIFDDQSVLTVDSNGGNYRVLHLGKDGNVIKKIEMTNSGKIGIAYAKMVDLTLFLKNNIGL